MIKQTFYFTYLFYLSILSFTSFSSLFSKEDKTYRLTAELEPVATVFDCVNAISGDFFYSNSDLYMDGPEPLSLTRVYDTGTIKKEGAYGVGVAMDIPGGLNVYEKGKEISLSVGRRQLAKTSYKKEKHQADGTVIQVSKDIYKLGYTNCSNGGISAKSHIKNSFFTQAKGQKNRWIYTLDDGTERYYDCLGGYDPKETSNFYRPVLDIQPNGNRVVYEYSGA